jgi:dolichyl-phosphate beta-glucosyltransferase
MARDVSIIVPAYNEERRIKSFLESLIEFSRLELKNYEIIVVNDGSKDKTLNIIKKIANGTRNLRLISYEPNQGKGYAVKNAIFMSKGKNVLFIDADGAIKPNQIPNMIQKLKEYDIVVGDRGHKASQVKQAKTRKLTGIIFNFYVSILFNSKVKDNLCGFKGFRREAALELFSNLIDKRWLFDVEIFYKIKKARKYNVYNLPIDWEHKTGSKISILDPIKMLFQLIKLRIKLEKQSKSF